MTEFTTAPRVRPGVGTQVDAPAQSQTLASDLPAPAATQTAPYAKKYLKVKTFDLTSARSNEPWHISGTVLWIVDGTDSSCTATITFGDDGSNDPLPVRPGVAVQGFPFERLQITNSAQSGKSITIAILNDTPDQRVTVQ